VTDLLVNHLTRMKDDRVCIAGLDNAGVHVRPLLPRHRPWTDDDVHPRGPIRLGSWLSMDGACRPDPPHTEDLVVDAWEVVGHCDYDVFLTELRSAAVPLAECFGAPHSLVPGRHVVVAPGAGGSSLAVVRVPSADLYQRSGRLRLGFEHSDLGEIDLKVNDVRFVPWTLRREQMPRLSQLLATSGALLTVGLTRAWPPEGQGNQWCWVQVNGIFVEDAELTGW
jgi:hypothetical protein